MKTRLIYITLALLFVLGSVLSGCTPSTPTDAPTTSETTEPSGTTDTGTTTTDTSTQPPATRETLTLNYMGGAVIEGIAKDQWWTKRLEEELGVILNVIAYSDEVYNTGLASGQLPDVIYLDGAPTKAPNAINAGLVVNFDDYASLLTNVFNQYPAGSLQFQRDTYGSGEFLYTLPDGPSLTAATDSHIEYGMRLAWEYYMEYVDANGEPEFNTLNDFLPVIKWMLDKHPENEDGQRNYGFTFFPSWEGGYYPMLAVYTTEMLGYYNGLFPLMINMNDLSYNLLWDDDGPAKKMLQFWFDANQMGLLDPDMGASDWGDFRAKADAHRTMACWQSWGTSYDWTKVVPFSEMRTRVYHGAWPLGNGNGSAIALWAGNTRGDEYIERSMEFINYMIEYDNAWFITYGPQGEFWDLNADGIPYITEFGATMSGDATVTLSDGGNPMTAGTMSTLGYWRYYNPNWIHPTFGVSYSTSGWAKLEGHEKTATQQSWEAWAERVHGVVPAPGAELSESRLIDGIGGFAPDLISGPMAPPELQEFASSMTNVYQSWWEMIYAKDQKTFDALWQSTQATLQGMWEASGLDASVLAKLYTDQLAINSKYID